MKEKTVWQFNLLLKDPNGQGKVTHTDITAGKILLLVAACRHVSEPIGYVSNHSAKEYKITGQLQLKTDDVWCLCVN